MGYINITDYDKVFITNTETGEIVSVVSLKKKKAPLPNIFTEKAKYVGIDIEYPAESLNSEKYFDAVSQIDGFVNNKTEVDTALILDYVVEGIWSKNDIKIINFLTTKVVAHNRVFTSLKEISENTGILQNHVSRWVKVNLHSCKVLNNRHGFVMDIHPSLAFKGSKEWRDFKIMDWYSVPYTK